MTYAHNIMIPVHYHIKLTHLFMETYDSCWAELLNFKIEYEGFNFLGESRTTINILQSTKYIKLHINLIIFPWKVTIIKNNGITYALKNFIPNSETNLSEYHFFDVLSPGLYVLKIGFHGRLTEASSKNFFKSFYTNKKNGIA